MKVENYLKQHKENKIWKTFLVIAALIVAFLTVYLLTKPAITMQGELICGIENHEHVASCYSEVENEITYICGLYEHTHHSGCYSSSGDLTCLQDEHEHILSCQYISSVSGGDAILSIESVQNSIITNDLSNENITNVQEDTSTNVIAKRRISFQDWINSFFVHHSNDNGYTWNEVQNGEVKKDDKLKFEILYDVPAYTLDTVNRTIEYDIPKNITIIKESSGIVYDKNGDAIGDYLITTDGIIYITFNDSFVEKNANGQIITGEIAFESSVANIEVDKKGSTTIEFNSELSITLDVVDLVENTSDLQVDKTASNINSDDGTISYTIIVSSENGTGQEIILTDEMRYNIGYLDSFSVIDDDGNIIEIETPEVGVDNFTLTLPALESGGTYTITYNAKLSNQLNGTIDIANDVKVSSKDKEGVKLEDNAYILSRFSKNMIVKTAEQSETEDIINWTININLDKVDITGYVLSDILNGTEYSNEVTLTDSLGNVQIITLPYTFPETSDSFTVTYTTTKDRASGESTVYNTAYLMTPNQEIFSSEKNVYVMGEYGGEYQPIKKYGDGTLYDDTNKRLELFWSSIFDAKNGDLVAPSVIKDSLHNYQYFTKNQLLEIVEQLNNIGLSYTILIDDTYTIDLLTDDGKYNSFIITLNDDIPKGTTFSFNYSSYIDLDDPTITASFINELKFNNNSSQYIEQKISPIVRKVDLYNPNSNPSSKDYFGTDSSTSDDDGIMSWGLYINIPENVDGEVIIEEVLPNGTNLIGLKTSINNTMYEQVFIQNDNIWTMTCNGYTINAIIQNDILYITIPENLNTSNEIFFEVKVKIKDDFEWTETTMSFENNVNIKDNEDNLLGSSSHTQNITKEEILEVLKKKTNLTSSSTDIIPYSIEVNSEGLNLDEDSDTITVLDILDYSGSYNTATINLVQSSLKIYKKNSDGTLIQLTSTDYSYTYEETVGEGNDWSPCQNELKIIVPDSTPLLIEYNYKVNGANGITIYNIINTSSLLDIPSAPGESSTKSDITISSSNASATIKGVIFIKKDANNNAILIPNVIFNLYEWNGSEYVIYQDENSNTSFVTDSNGEVMFSNLKINTAYKLVEYQPALGYQNIEPIYFTISNNDIETYPILKPDDFSGLEISQGIPILIENERPTTEISVDKIWLDANGNTLKETPASVNINLWRYAIPQGIINLNPNKKLTYTFQMGPTNEYFYEETNYTFNANTKIRLILNYTGYSWPGNNPLVYLGDTLLTNLTPQDENYADGDVFTYEFLAENSSTIKIVTNDWNQSTWNHSFEILSSGIDNNIDLSSYLENEPYKKISLSLANNWYYKWSNLPLIGQNENGEVVDYVYFVTEDSVYGYNTEIYNDENHFTIKNKLEGISENYVLPATGGIGLPLYFLIICCFIGIVILILYLKNRDI